MNAVVNEARSWIGTPFKHQHRAKGVGVDCAGLVIGVARVLGFVSPDFDINGYARSPDGRTLIDECDRHMERVSRETMAPGDVVMVRWEREPQHVGILSDYPHGGLAWIHAFGLPSGGKVIEQRFDLALIVSGGSFVGAWRFR